MKLGKQLALAALVLAGVVPARAQFRSGGFGSSLQLLAMPEVRKELKLTEAQTTQIMAVQGNFKGEFLGVLRGLKNVPQQDKRKKMESFRSDLDRKLVLILEPGQRKRLHELELQRMGPRALLKPDVEAELRLNPTQKASISTAARNESQSIRDAYKIAAQDNTPARQEEARHKIETIQVQTDSSIYDVLTAAQKKQFQTMQGAPFKFPEQKAPVTSVKVSSPTAGKPAGK